MNCVSRTGAHAGRECQAIALEFHAGLEVAQLHVRDVRVERPILDHESAVNLGHSQRAPQFHIARESTGCAIDLRKQKRQESQLAHLGVRLALKGHRFPLC